MTILITGISGFVGSYLSKSLSSLNEVTKYGLDIKMPACNDVKMIFDWDEFDRIPKIDIIIHLAGKAHDTKNQSEASSYFEINRGLTKKIYDWFLKSTAQKFIFFSSVKAAADTVIGDILTEDVVPIPKGPYGVSKRAAEKYILENLPLDKQVYILRPCMIHGPGNKGNLNLLYNIVSKEIPWPLGKFDNKRSFCSIDNLSFIISNLIEKDIEPGIYQVADDEALSTNELIRLIASSQKRKAKIWNVPYQLVKFSAKTGDYLHLPLNSERLRKLTESYVVSNQKIKKSLKIEKMPVSTTEGFKNTFKSFQK